MGYRNYSTNNGFIVDQLGNGDFTTLNAALAAAPADTTIYIRPGSYTEDLTVTKNITFTSNAPPGRFGVGYAQVKIIGKTTVNTNGIIVNFHNVQLLTNGDFIGSNTANSAIQYFNCEMDCTNNTGFNVNGSLGNTDILIAYSDIFIRNGQTLADVTNGVLTLRDCSNLDAVAPTATNSGANGIIYANYTVFMIPFTTSSNGEVHLNFCAFGTEDTPFQNTTWLTTSGTATAFVDHCRLFSGTASAASAGVGTIILMTQTTVFSNNTNAITGAGTLTYGSVTFSGASSTINTVTQIPLTTLP